MDYSSMTITELSAQYDKWADQAYQCMRHGDFNLQQACQDLCTRIHSMMVRRNEDYYYEP